MVRLLVVLAFVWSLNAAAQDGGSAAVRPAQEQGPEELAQQVDALHPRRDDSKVVAQMETLLQDGLKASPDDYGLLWRMARLRHWQADGVQGDKQKELGREGWAYGDRAIKANPSGAEGHYFSGIALGAYSTGAGIMKALSEGLEARFVDRIDKATKLSPGLDRGGPLVAKGRYHYELPWPKRDLDKSAELLLTVTKKHPENLRAWLYLAQTQLKEGEAKTAKQTLQKVFSGSTAYDPPEAKRVLTWAKNVQVQIEKELK